ncbi:hypothetical protein E2C01_098443 [Portunus trituberculatus]|uniref:Uncharacterized protein n=1 Tax=Portunus trituberculatus TaxID=210409 RepID=A0A5B7KC39_PORTR|nr:hypothetical protein [Portunus trituberculatus]
MVIVVAVMMMVVVVVVIAVMVKVMVVEVVVPSALTWRYTHTGLSSREFVLGSHNDLRDSARSLRLSGRVTTARDGGGLTRDEARPSVGSRSDVLSETWQSETQDFYRYSRTLCSFTVTIFKDHSDD